MANFKVGQRVKRIEDCPIGYWRGFVGCTGIVVGFTANGIDVQYDNGPLHLSCAPYKFAPLTDPDAWAADAVRKVTRPQHMEPEAPKVRETEKSARGK